VPRLVAVGHVTFDRIGERDVPGGSVSYAALAARRLGWEAAVVTRAGDDFDPARDLPGVTVACTPAARTTRFVNEYDAAGRRRQRVTARAEPIDLGDVPEDLRRAEAVLLAPVVGEITEPAAALFEAGVVGATGQGWMRSVAASGEVARTAFQDAATHLLGVHVLFLSEGDLPAGGPPAGDLLACVPMVALTRGWEGVQLLSRDGILSVPGLARREVDPTGAGDVFAAAFLVRYHETADPAEAAAFAVCAASCAVEGVGASSLGDRAEVEHRRTLHERLVEEGEWDE